MSYYSKIASRTVSIASGSLADDDGIKTSFATATSETVLLPVNLNGAVVSSGKIVGLPRVLTITRSNNAGQFSTAPIVVNYKRGGAVLSESLVPANANGNDLVATIAAIDEIVSIVIPAQGGTGGTFLIGVRDICAYAGDAFIGVEVAAAGTLYVQYGENAQASSDAIVIPTALVGYVKPIGPTRIQTGAGKTSVGVTVYLP